MQNLNQKTKVDASSSEFEIYVLFSINIHYTINSIILKFGLSFSIFQNTRQITFLDVVPATHTLFWVGVQGGGLFFFGLRRGSEGGDRV